MTTGATTLPITNGVNEKRQPQERGNSERENRVDVLGVHDGHDALRRAALDWGERAHGSLGAASRSLTSEGKNFHREPSLKPGIVPLRASR